MDDDDGSWCILQQYLWVVFNVIGEKERVGYHVVEFKVKVCVVVGQLAVLAL